MRSKLCFFLTLLPCLCFSQTGNRLAIEVSSGIQTGWWLYNKGSTDANLFNNQGWDRTRHIPFLPFEVNALYRMNRFKIGLGIDYSFLFGTKMIGSRDSDNLTDKYRISNGAMKILKYNIQAEFDLVQKPKFTMSPNVKFGIFKIDTLHPQKDNFGRKHFWEFGLTNEIKFSKLSVIVRPIYSAYQIQPREKLTFNEQHNIYSFGLNLGFRYWLK